MNRSLYNSLRGWIWAALPGFDSDTGHAFHLSIFLMDARKVSTKSNAEEPWSWQLSSIHQRGSQQVQASPPTLPCLHGVVRKQDQFRSIFIYDYLESHWQLTPVSVPNATESRFSRNGLFLTCSHSIFFHVSDTLRFWDLYYHIHHLNLFPPPPPPPPPGMWHKYMYKQVKLVTDEHTPHHSNPWYFVSWNMLMNHSIKREVPWNVQSSALMQCKGHSQV